MKKKISKVIKKNKPCHRVFRVELGAESGNFDV